MIHFAASRWYFLLVAYAIFCVAYLRACKSAGALSIVSVRGRTLNLLGIHAVAAVLLIVAAAGPEWSALTRNLQLIVAADVSDSVNVFYLPRQTERISELLSSVGSDCEVGVVVFGRTAATERSLAPLPPEALEAKSARRSSTSEDSLNRGRVRTNALPPLPGLDKDQRSSVIDTSATDIGGAIDACRNLFPSPDKTRAILLLSDFRDTEGHANAGAAALSGTGIDLLTAPVIISDAPEAHIQSIHVPDETQLGRTVPVEITVAGIKSGPVRVELWVQAGGPRPSQFQAKNVELTRESGPPGAELTRTVRFDDIAGELGVRMYSCRIGTAHEPPAGDAKANDTLSAAVRVTGPSKWAVLTRHESTLTKLATDPLRPLGVECKVFETEHFPTRGADYRQFSGILIDGLSATELPEPAVAAVADAARAGKGIVAMGGERAYGAGEHKPEGKWEQLLPIEMTPEDDRTRSVLFVIDISSSMEDPMGNAKKIDFAEAQLALAVQKLQPLDRVGLIAFSETAECVAALSDEPTHAKFLDALSKLKISANATDLRAPIKKAGEVLKGDDAEEQLIVLLSDGEITTPTPPEAVLAAVRALCPETAEPGAQRHTSVFTFGIGTDPKENTRGDALMKDIATAGGGVYSAEFNLLAQRLEKAFESKNKGFYKRREPYTVRSASTHPLVSSIGQELPAPMQFRNRVKAKPDADVLLLSSSAQDQKQKGARRPDPLLVLSGSTWPGAGRCAAAALSWDDKDGESLLASPSGKQMLPALLEWAEARNDAMPDGWTLTSESTRNGDLLVELHATELATVSPINGLSPVALLTELDPQNEKASLTSQLIPNAPGLYRAVIHAPAAGRVHKLVVSEGARILPERFVTIPFSAERTQLGVDRSAMVDLVQAAGGSSRAIERPQHLKEWADEKSLTRAMKPLAGWLIVTALVVLLGLYAFRRN